ncbi:SWIM zinc finger protein [Chania multitudinisentens RB-25]|uniref:SWIM zinc finger protein n=1 Tax=Chania multitudinisentens RB-25 TaxID=1441930 RepID=W0LF70_9GAMM|nr:SWIM zinc finger family protein [Chania multitudinisentens]AHG20917.1 SWIM zinc finger protein [Chania multitudinisentens RB-25]
MSWRTLYTHYDDDALIVFANAGLLRRARKDLDKVILTDAANGAFSSDGQEVVLAPEGIQKARCNCSAPGCCKHILAAVLWLQANAAPAAALPSAEEPSPPLLPGLLALDAVQLIKKSNKAECRLALKWWQQWQSITLRLEDNGTQLKIYLPDFDEPIIFMHASGYEGMLSSLPEQQQKAIHLAAIAKLFEQHGQSWPWPENLTETDGPRPLSDDEIALIHTVKTFIHSLLQQGLSHVSKSSATQLHLLNMSARAEGLPRLAAYLRGLSGQVALLAEKHFTLDESQVLRYLARLSAYLYQLTHAPIATLPQVRGQLRRQYNEKNDVLSLVPISANWWLADSGALGATFTFWDSDNQQLLQSTQARANRLDTQFHRQNVWSSLSFWKQTADSMMRKPFQLHHPRLSDEGTLAASGDAYAKTAPSLLSIDALQTLKTQFGTDNWQTLEHDFAQQLDDFLTPYVLYPKDYKSLAWYETEQCVVWEINDRADNAVFLRLYWGKAEQSSFEELRYITEKRLTVLAVSVQPVRKEQGIDFIPTTLWLKKEDGVELFYLDFDHYPRKKKPSMFISHIQNYMARKKQQSAILLGTVPTLAQQLSRPLLSVLEAQACTGRYGLSPQQKNDLAQCLQTANDLGMAFLASQLKHYLAQPVSQAENLLRLIWLCDRLQQLQSPLPIHLTGAEP